MSFSTWLAFFAAAWAISFSPGPGAISAMASGLKYGFRRGYWTTIGLILGILIQFVVVAVGLGALLAASGLASRMLKLLRSPRHIRWLNRTFGALFILAGTVLASFSHHK
ncbi:LysE family transporter [Alcaligenaceae bacterium]|nr:LysE family transporter [Alcaligenaceae bacterium]